MVIPAALIAAICDTQGRAISLVLGAGCSMESPTGLPSSSDCSREVLRMLVRDGIVQQSDVSDPSDLSNVADVTVRATKNDQTPLVHALLTSYDFLDAQPNSGHLDAIALMLEGSVLQIVTINFDLALVNAKSKLSAESISVIRSVADFAIAGPKRLIFAHGNANSNPEDWILQSEKLKEVWKGTWAEALTQSAMANPFVVCVGMGSSAPLISHCASFIKKRVPNQDLYQVDPMEFGKADFTSEVGLSQDHYMPCGWNDFMRMASDLLLSEQLNEIQTEAQKLISQDPRKNDNIHEICSLVQRLGLTYFGELRAKWFLSEKPYLPRHDATISVFADLFLGIARIVGVMNGTIEAYIKPYFLLKAADHRLFALLPICALGTHSIDAAQSAAQELAKAFQREGTNSTPVYLAVGYQSGQGSPVESLLEQRLGEDIISSDIPYRVIDVSQLRQSANPAELLEAP